MKFREIFRFEFLYQARRVRTWLYFAVLFIIEYLLNRTAGGGEVHIHSQYDIAQETIDRKSTDLNSSHLKLSRMPSSA